MKKIVTHNTFRKPKRAQSAMEYLMTYGWAILVIAVVLGALFYTGIFNSSSMMGTVCVAYSGFYCSNPILSTSGILNVTIGQATSMPFSNAYVYFVPSGSSFESSDPNAYIGTIQPGQQVQASIPLTAGGAFPSSYSIGTSISGQLYLVFTDVHGLTETDSIAKINVKVSTVGSGSPQTTPSQGNTPSGIVAYVPITINNGQSTPTPAPFQQMI
ncbi:MAG: hypothetical protein ACP5LP_02880, partial [Candidatus Micrarchaeia archaeon]